MVLGSLIDRDDQTRLPSHRVDDEGVTSNCEVYITERGIVFREGLTEVLTDLLLIIGACAEPEEPLPLRPEHLAQLIIRECLITLEGYLGDRHALTLIYIEDEPVLTWPRSEERRVGREDRA